MVFKSYSLLEEGYSSYLPLQWPFAAAAATRKLLAGLAGHSSALERSEITRGKIHRAGVGRKGEKPSREFFFVKEREEGEKENG